MNDHNREICEKAVRCLRNNDAEEQYRLIRLRYADQIELQYLIGDPERDEVAVTLAEAILAATKMVEINELVEYGHWSDDPEYWAGGEYAV